MLEQEESDSERTVEDIEDFAGNRLSIPEGTVNSRRHSEREPPSSIRVE